MFRLTATDCVTEKSYYSQTLQPARAWRLHAFKFSILVWFWLARGHASSPVVRYIKDCMSGQID
jgi:hypothetical protein